MFENSKIRVIEGTGIPLRGNDVDTDRIIPARFLKCVTFDGLGENVFRDERFDKNGRQKNHPFNDSRYHGGKILIVNKNFGCGSSREHAPQALQRFGIKAIIGESFAEIFIGNCTTIGMPAITAYHDTIEDLMTFVEQNPSAPIVINLESKEVCYGSTKKEIDMPESSRYVLTEGKWDSVTQLLRNKTVIEKTAGMVPYLHWG